MEKEEKGNTTIYRGERLTYAFSKGLPMLLISSNNELPSKELRITLPVKNKKTAEQIIKLLEL